MQMFGEGKKDKKWLAQYNRAEDAHLLTPALELHFSYSLIPTRLFLASQPSSLKRTTLHPQTHQIRWTPSTELPAHQILPSSVDPSNPHGPASPVLEPTCPFPPQPKLLTPGSQCGFWHQQIVHKLHPIYDHMT